MPHPEDPTLMRFARVPFAVQVELDRVRLKVREILELKAGSVVVLKKPAGENFDVLVGGTRIGSGEVVIVENFMAVRLSGLEEE